MQPTLLYLTYLSAILFISIICVIIAKKIHISNILLLILVGIVLGKATYNGAPLIVFEPGVLAVIGVFTLVLIIFNECSKLKLHTFDTLSFGALRLSFVFMAINLFALTFLMHSVYRTPLAIAAIFAAAMAGTDTSAVLLMLKQAKTKALRLLEIESIVDTPLMVIIPFLILEIMSQPSKPQFVSYIAPFAQQFITGIGAGLLIALIISKVAAKRYSPMLSPIVLITSALLTYVVAESLGGSGVLAVTTFSVFLGSIHFKHMEKVQEFSAIFTLLLELLVFVLLGVVLKIPLTTQFLVSSLLLFAAFVGIRFVSVHLSFRKQTFTFNERILMTLVMPKGITTAILLLALSTIALPGLQLLLEYGLAFTVYSIILASIALSFVKSGSIEK